MTYYVHFKKTYNINYNILIGITNESETTMETWRNLTVTLRN